LPHPEILIEYPGQLDLASWHWRLVVNQNSKSVADDAKRIYEERLRAMLEQSHMNEFVAIEPISGEYFLGRTLSDAIGASRSKYPNRLVHALRVGHEAAIHFGFQVR
jgi:hypothetical protein